MDLTTMLTNHMTMATTMIRMAMTMAVAPVAALGLYKLFLNPPQPLDF
jgi:hypothetical protein